MQYVLPVLLVVFIALPVLPVVFIALKVTDNITWGWGMVLWPLWVHLVLSVIVWCVCDIC